MEDGAAEIVHHFTLFLDLLAFNWTHALALAPFLENGSNLEFLGLQELLLLLAKEGCRVQLVRGVFDVEEELENRLQFCAQLRLSL